jgi:P27 family predicted phage terminase small subunit
MARGRKPLPTQFKLLTGNAGKRPLNLNEPKPRRDLDTPPDWLSEAQAAIFKEAIAEAPKSMLKTIDSAILGVWCQALDTIIKSNASLQMHGLYSEDEKGNRKAAPEHNVIAKFDAVLVRTAAELGFTPSARSRVAIAEEPEQKANPFALIGNGTDD